MNYLDDLASAIFSACHNDLPHLDYHGYVSPSDRKAGVEPEVKTRRPEQRDIEVQMFEQTWGSTALGHGGVGCSAVTTANTTIITCHNTCAVYFGGRYCYSVRRDCPQFQEDVRCKSVRSKQDASKNYIPAKGVWI